MSDRLDLTDDLALQQGERFEMEILYPGDLTERTFKGQIRDRYEGQLLTSFQFEAATYDAETGLTTIRPYLTPAQTSALRWTPGNKRYVFDIDAELVGSDPIRILPPGKVQVMPEVTLNG